MSPPSEVQAAVSDLDRRVYAAIACYAPDEAECFPSQRLIALDLGIRRETVNRCVHRLREAGWLVISKRWAGPWAKWMHNVYELHAEYAVSTLALRRITRRAHRRARQRAWMEGVRARDRSFDHTNREVWGGSCGCRYCRPDRTGVGRPPRRFPRPVSPLRRIEMWAEGLLPRPPDLEALNAKLVAQAHSRLELGRVYPSAADAAKCWRGPNVGTDPTLR